MMVKVEQNTEDKKETPPAEAVIGVDQKEEKEAKGGGKKEKKPIKPRGRKKKTVKQVDSGRVYIQATYNNTLVTITDPAGNVLAWSSAGLMGFKGPKKSTPYAAGIIVKNVVEKVQPHGFKEAVVLVRGIGAGRDAAVRALYANGLNISSIKDVTPIPHNGCRPPKARRV